ncbi:MAG: hypothetical protein JW986_05585 [Methanotrichaceae archaeon]|nr:hypothetical protein [Methanotrichaceae archaeon]
MSSSRSSSAWMAASRRMPRAMFLPGKDDVVHDLLAFLAEEMTEMNRRKQDEIKGFLR